MALTLQKRLDLLNLAKEHWIDAESTSYAYEREISFTKKLSDFYRISTILCAGLTTISAGVDVRFQSPLGGWFTLGVGVLTTVLAAIEKQLSPTDKYERYLGCRVEIEGVKQDLNSFSITLESVEDLVKGDPLKQFNQKIIEIKQKMLVLPKDIEKTKARETFVNGTIGQMILRDSRKIERIAMPIEEANLAELPDDAPNIVAVSRSRRAIGR
jgi:hypothetical protein